MSRTAEVQEVEAAAIARGIDRWYRTRDPGSGYRPPFVDETSTGDPPCVDPALQ